MAASGARAGAGSPGARAPPVEADVDGRAVRGVVAAVRIVAPRARPAQRPVDGRGDERLHALELSVPVRTVICHVPDAIALVRVDLAPAVVAAAWAVALAFRALRHRAAVNGRLEPAVAAVLAAVDERLARMLDAVVEVRTAVLLLLAVHVPRQAFAQALVQREHPVMEEAREAVRLEEPAPADILADDVELSFVEARRRAVCGKLGGIEIAPARAAVARIGHKGSPRAADPLGTVEDLFEHDGIEA